GALIETWRAFRGTAGIDCEGAVFWAGPKHQQDSEQQIVTTVLVPRQRVGHGAFELTADGVRAMGRRLRDEGLVNLAQVHTHPTEGVEHSSWDDAHAFSQRDGVLSIVWPRFGEDLAPTLA